MPEKELMSRGSGNQEKNEVTNSKLVKMADTNILIKLPLDK